MTKKKNDTKPKAAATLAERLRKLAAELDVATGEAPERISDEAAIAAHVVEITRPGSFKKRLLARRKAKASETESGDGDDGSPASPPAMPAASKRRQPAAPSPPRPRKR